MTVKSGNIKSVSIGYEQDGEVRYEDIPNVLGMTSHMTTEMPERGYDHTWFAEPSSVSFTTTLDTDAFNQLLLNVLEHFQPKFYLYLNPRTYQRFCWLIHQARRIAANISHHRGRKQTMQQRLAVLAKKKRR